MKLALRGRDKEGPIQLQLEAHNQFARPGHWLRGIFHCHVAQMGEPARVCDHYQRLGFHFLGSSDYNRVTPMPASSASFTTLQGAEIYCPRQVDLLHVICTGLQQDVVPLSGATDDVARLVEETRNQGGLSILAHPSWSDLTWHDLVQMTRTGMAGFEVSNRLCWLINGKGRADQIWHMLLREQNPLAAIGADDANCWDPQLVGQTWTGVLATERSPAGILDALRHHRTYASEGPRLREITFDAKGVVRVQASPCRACHFISRGFGARSVHVDQDGRQFELDLAADGYRLEDWLCISLEDERGRRAWSSAIPLKAVVSRI